jgi:hypothetical protein
VVEQVAELLDIIYQPVVQAVMDVKAQEVVEVEPADLMDILQVAGFREVTAAVEL